MNSNNLSPNDLILHILSNQSAQIEEIRKSQVELDKRITKEVAVRSTLISLASSGAFSGILWALIEKIF